MFRTLRDLLRRGFGGPPDGTADAARAPAPDRDPDHDLDQGLAELLPLLEGAGLAPDPRELAEVLWLAGHMAAAAPAAPRRASAPRPEARPQTPPADRPRDDPPGPAAPPASAARSAPPETAPAPRLYPRTGGRGGTFAIPYRAPAAPALPDALGLARALRPLHRRLPARTRRRLDEDATAECMAGHRLARHGFWEPVLVPARERWFELALVIDRGATMAVWAPLLAELRRLFEYQGAFSRVRLWGLDAAGPLPRLYRGFAAGPGRPCRPGEPAAGGGRCLVLVVSDCLDPAWHSGAVQTWLRDWGARAPLALVQPLPRRLWDGTALGRVDPVRLAARTAAPLAPDLRLCEAPRGAAGAPGLRLPVLTLEPESLRGWAKVLCGRAEAWCAGVRFGPATRYAPPAPAGAAPGAAAPEPDPAEVGLILADFLAAASPPARRLAALLAAAPLTLPVMRLVQRTRLPRSGQTHLAEVLISGLLRRVPGLEAGPGVPFYDFRGPARRRLLDGLGARESREVLLQVSAFVAARTGSALDFAAPGRLQGLAGPAAAGLDLDDPALRHFAEVGDAVLRRLGGDYRRLAEALAALARGDRPGLERVLGAAAGAAGAVGDALKASTGPTPFRDAFLDGSGPGPALVWLPDGDFRMGSPPGIGYDDERPAHEVRLGQHAVGKYPVTVGEFRRFVEATGYRTEAEAGDGATVRVGDAWKRQSDHSFRKRLR